MRHTIICKLQPSHDRDGLKYFLKTIVSNIFQKPFECNTVGVLRNVLQSGDIAVSFSLVYNSCIAYKEQGFFT